MDKKLFKRMEQALKEEDSVESDINLLNRLREFASEPTDYLSIAPERRNALNDWFSEVKDLLLQELLEGNFGAQILIDTFFILCFEVGYKLGKIEMEKGD